MMRRKGKPMPTQPQEPVWWKVIVGALLILVEVKNHAFPPANLLKANNEEEQLGMYIAMVVLIGLGCWLVYSGIKPIWRKTG
jgi:hypothetical protein